MLEAECHRPKSVYLPLLKGDLMDLYVLAGMAYYKANPYLLCADHNSSDKDLARHVEPQSRILPLSMLTAVRLYNNPCLSLLKCVMLQSLVS